MSALQVVVWTDLRHGDLYRTPDGLWSSNPGAAAIYPAESASQTIAHLRCEFERGPGRFEARDWGQA